MKFAALRFLLLAGVTLLAVAAMPAAFAQSTQPASGLLYQNHCSPGIFDSVSDDAKTKYPIVLVTGATGTAPNFLLPGYRYWYGIPEALCRAGATVYVASLPAVDTDYSRGPILVDQIKALMAVLGVDKVNLIAHSQGGITARYAAATLAPNIASVTTIGTPHKGMGLADVLLSNAVFRTAAVAGFTAAGLVGDAVNGSDGAVRASGLLSEASRAGIAQFNAQYPSAGLSTAQCVGADDDTGIRQVVDTRTAPDGTTIQQMLYSWTGDAPVPPFSPDLAGSTLMGVLQPMVLAGRDGANDGVIGVCSARFGQVLGTYHWNHLTEINQLAGLVPPFEPNPVRVIVNHANRLKNLGM